jgi:hypothetical protein
MRHTSILVPIIGTLQVTLVDEVQVFFFNILFTTIFTGDIKDIIIVRQQVCSLFQIFVISGMRL